jgi:branched-chain amino acid transport system ATP-binding protein
MTDGDGLILEGVSAGYGETIVLERIDLELSPGGTSAVLGRNGVGKTTLIATIVGRTRLRAGSIRFAGREVRVMRPFRRARLGIGLVPQEREIFPSLTVAENLLVAARPGRWSLDQVFDFFPALAERRRHRGNQLSGGEQQMLAIGRALIGNPSLLLLDEPLEGLAPVIVDALLTRLDRLKAAGDLALLLVEQHARLALEMTDRAIVLERGAIVFSGPSRELLAAPGRLDALLSPGERRRGDPCAAARPAASSPPGSWGSA